MSTQSDQQKRPKCKSAQKMQKKKKKKKKKKNYQLLKKISPVVSLTRHFTKFIYLEQLTAMSPVQYARYVVVFFFFLSSHHDTKPLFQLYISFS